MTTTKKSTILIARTVKTSKHTLIQYLRYYETDQELDDLMTADLTELEELKGILKSFKNKKSPGNDGMNTELLKYAPVEIKIRYLNIINICWNMHKIPDEWTREVICSILKKKEPYRIVIRGLAMKFSD
jgi:hypothetical protein